MKFFKNLICKYFGHKWEPVKTNDYFSQTWKCKRCGKTQVISRKR